MSVDQAPGTFAAEPLSPPPGTPERPSRGRGARTSRGRRGRRRARRGLLYALGAFVVAALVWWVGWASPATLVEHVVVDVPPGISEKAVRKMSGISASDHVPGVDAALVERNVMSALPAVASVEVHRQLPNTVALTVTARVPFAALPRGDLFVIVDPAGVEFDHRSSAGKLPVIRGASYEGGRSALAVLQSLPDDLRADVRSVTASTQHDADLHLSDGAIVRWGSPDEAQLKARVLAGLRSVKARHYDVSAPMMPTTSHPSQ